MKSLYDRTYGPAWRCRVLFKSLGRLAQFRMVVLTVVVTDTPTRSATDGLMSYPEHAIILFRALKLKWEFPFQKQSWNSRALKLVTLANFEIHDY
ncbi:hypothetical protein EVAR_81008_1 [Eumeta japonica]|uniref:Uncharacterized protein n=1 Tax=Eumeta variegata TaxID=151549 RepID=A0A4C1T8H2_EUMVA|nr:hypothetical protein EVAR_81008_1 [Eumeta japonica]